jgi:hypothetical protein
MLQHIVLMKLKKEINGEDLSNLCECLDSLFESIPGIISASAGENLFKGEACRGYNYGIFIDFENRDALNHYLSHPIHRHFADNYVHKLRDGDLLVFDYCFD